MNRTAAMTLTGLMCALAGSACSVSVDDGQVSFVDEDAQLFCEEGGSLALAAQAVPGASFIPCIDEMPAGWSVDRTDFDDAGVEIKIDSRRAPIDDMLVNFSADCEPGADVVPDETLGFDTPAGSATTQDVDGLDVRVVVTADGWCTQYELSLEAAEVIGVDDFPTIVFVSRDSIDAGVAEATDDRLRLDP